MAKSEQTRTLSLAILVVVLVVALGIEGIHLARVNAKLDRVLEARAVALPAAAAAPLVMPATPPAQALNRPNVLPLPTPFFKDEDWLLPRAGEWDPFQEMDRMQKRMDRMFNDAFGQFSNSPRFGGLVQDLAISPNLDLADEGDHYTVRVDIPGVEESKININLEDQQLTISGTLDKTVEQKEGKGYIRRERRQGSFERSVTLPGPVQADKIESKYENGVLVITLPKAQEK